MLNDESRAAHANPASSTTPIVTDDSSSGAGQLHIPEILEGDDTLSAAMKYAEAGFYVLPVRMNTKHAGSVVGKGWPAKSSRDPKQIAAWFTGTDYGIALHCGRSGVVAFDVDHPDKMPDELLAAVETTGCPYQSTRPDEPGRGHYLFLQPAGRMIGNSGGGLGGTWGEVRGNNGVVILAPSQARYRWQRAGEIPALPDYLADKLHDSATAESAASDAEVQAFIAAHTAAERPDVINGLKSGLAGKIEKGESRHKSTTSAVTGACKEARAGYYPAQTVIDTFWLIFSNAVAIGENKRTGDAAKNEWDGIVAWAVAQANAADIAEIRARTEEKMPAGTAEEVEDFPLPPTPPAPPPADPITLSEAHTVFTKWLGEDYDTDSLDAMLATLAVERFRDGSDPLWMLIIGGPGNAKTETVQACDGLGAIVTSSISSEAALLSATPKRERSKQATGGLLRKLGDEGVLVIKDVTSILSMNNDLRARVLAALREVYDGRWYREVGTDGGMTIPWHGRAAVIGAVTTAWDTAHAVISSMGDRFVLVRLDSAGEGRQRAGRNAIRNTGSEQVMRAELAAAVAGVIAGMNPEPITVTDDETDVLLAAADLVTLARTGVEVDYRGDVIDAHAPEMPTRFAKQLTQIVRGAVAIGMARDEALRLAIRCARDSMPPMRLAIIEYLAGHPDSSTADVRKGIDKPRATVDRQLQALHILGVAAVDECEYGADSKTKWYYSLADRIDPSAIDPSAIGSKGVPEKSVHTPSPSEEGLEEQSEEHSPEIVTDFSGTPGDGPPPTSDPGSGGAA